MTVRIAAALVAAGVAGWLLGYKRGRLDEMVAALNHHAHAGT